MNAAAVLHQRHDSVLEIVLNRPDRRNALSLVLLGELRRTFEGLPAGTRAVVLSGAGPAFAAGADFADLTGTADDLHYDEALDAACSAVRTCPVPVVAAVHGACVGAGVELATSCDARIAGPGAWFRVPAVELGLLYNPSSIRKLHAMLPRTTVTRLLVLAERFDAAEAVRAGLATHAAEDPREHAVELARMLAGLPEEALAATRGLLAALDAGEASDADWQQIRMRLLDSPDRRAAVAAASRKHAQANRPTDR